MSHLLLVHNRTVAEVAYGATERARNFLRVT